MIRSEHAAHIALTQEAQRKPIIKYWEQPYIPAATRIEGRRNDLSAANKVKGKAGGFLRSAAMKALNNVGKIFA